MAKKLTKTEREAMAQAVDKQRKFIAETDYVRYAEHGLDPAAIRRADYDYLRLLERAATTGEPMWPDQGIRY